MAAPRRLSSKQASEETQKWLDNEEDDGSEAPEGEILDKDSEAGDLIENDSDRESEFNGSESENEQPLKADYISKDEKV
jgi:hypothetical protein